jgi:hypothetical protein
MIDRVIIAGIKEHNQNIQSARDIIPDIALWQLRGVWYMK